jgi:hypothetical protein
MISLRPGRTMTAPDVCRAAGVAGGFLLLVLAQQFANALACGPADAPVLLGNHIQHADERGAHLLCYGGRLRWGGQTLGV